jgi:hypothetical protein
MRLVTGHMAWVDPGNTRNLTTSRLLIHLIAAGEQKLAANSCAGRANHRDGSCR